MNITVGELKKILENVDDDTEIIFSREYSRSGGILCQKVEVLLFLPHKHSQSCNIVKDENILTDLGRKNAKRGIFLS